MGQAWFAKRNGSKHRRRCIDGKKLICQFRVVLVGESSVGKTSLVLRLTEGTFAEGVQMTSGVDFYIHTLRMPAGQRVKLQVWDLAGRLDHRSFTISSLYTMLGVLLIFDITKRHSLDYIGNWLDETREVFNQCKCTFILVGHKSDLSTERNISREEAEHVAEGLGMRYIETSAKDDTNIKEVFHMLASSIAGLVKSEIEDSLIASAFSFSTNDV
ncbi:ras-related protein Rab-39B-like [Narcine bancroftii]|uniref:ras-related protein Rab-39B-like n=1 Tax=Narcine bancroftii TaxID=1343680 RepID=UPI0038321ADC